MFDVPPKCPALANKLSGLFGWRHTYKVAAKHEGIPHGTLHKSYSLTLPKRPPSPSYDCVKEAGSWVAVHHLQTQSGILDPDDCVRDVADDREQILAHFEDSGPDPGVPQGGGDGASGSSSVGTGSPDIFRDPTNTEAPTRDLSTPHIEVTSTTSGPMAGLGVGLMVRRSSDPNLLASLKSEGSNKRWSAAAPHYAGGDSPERLLLDKAGGQLSPQWEEEDDAAAQLKEQLLQQQQLLQPAAAGGGAGHQPFARSGRLSMQFLGDGNGYKWMEAAEKLQHQQQPQPLPSSSLPNSAYSSKSLPRESKRKEPLGQAYESIREKDGEMLLIINEYGSPLGLTAMPDKEHGGGLLVQHVEPGSRAERGRLRRDDRILEINGIKLLGLSESQVQEQLRRALESSELRVRVLRGDQRRRQQQQQQRRDSKVAEMVEVATVSPTRKPHAAPVGTSLQVANTRKLGRKIEILLKKGPNGLGFSVTTRDNPAGGHCPIYIKNILPRGAAIEDGRLKPGDRLLEVDGTPMTGKTQTDVVAILRGMPAGATVRIVVSRQQELAEMPVGTETVEKQVGGTTATAGAGIAPGAGAGATAAPVSIPVQKSSSARSLFQQQQQQQQAQLNESQHFIDAGSESAASNDSLPPSSSSWHSREELTLHIPVHDTEKAGLGVSVKGKTCSNLNSSSASAGSVKHDGDLGIFVKNVIHGGAASRDGRLRMNDQLLSVNGVSLRGQNNAEAMETLRRAMVNNPGKHPGTITLLVGRKILRSASSSDILEHSHSHSNSSGSGSGSGSNSNNCNNNSSSNASDNSGATVIYLSPEKREPRGGSGNGPGSAGSDMNRWSNPVLDRLTGGICSSNSAQPTHQQQQHHQQHQHHQQQQQQQTPQSQSQSQRRLPPPPATLRNESYYMATNDNWSPAQLQLLNGHGNTALLIEDDAEPMSPTLPVRNHDGQHCNASSGNTSQAGAGQMGQMIGGIPTPGGATTAATTTAAAGGTATSAAAAAANFDATYSSQLSLETNNSGVEHFSRDALGRRSISEKHHAALDARETGTYQRNKKLREERERERRIQLTKSAVYGGSIESLTLTRIASANAQMAAAAAGYKHAKTSSHIEQREQQQREQQMLAAEAEARDQLGDLGPSLGLKKSSSLESLQTMVQELQMSDEPRAHHALRAPRGRGREDSLRAAVVSEPDANKPRKTWLLEEGDHEGGFSSQRNGPFQSSLNDGKHGSKSRAKKPSILRGIGHMFRFGKNRKDGVVPVDSYATSTLVSAAPNSAQHQQQQQQLQQQQQQQQQIPAAALAALERNGKPPAYQPPPPLPAPNASGGGGGGAGGAAVNGGSALNGGIHQNDIFNHRYQHYANYEDLHQHQISSCSSDDIGVGGVQEALSESTLECMRQQVIRQRIKVEAESRRHQHYHSQRSARSQDISMHSTSSQQQQQQQPPLPLPPSAAALQQQSNGGLRPMSSYYEYDTVQQQQRVGSIKHSNHNHSHGSHQLHNGNNNSTPSPISVNVAQPHWKAAALNGFSPASLNSSARSRGPFVTQVTIREQSGMPQQQQQQPTYQTVQKAQSQSQSQYGSAAGAQPHASKV
ncbi:partitioning defective 3 homolog isoform X1 [Drosophila nasuta]|uniref:partitioning defective 3 homolog isoform X1 n=1 Tax=Drosophila nasuta TaxID=42062 RepID=UPI00295E9FB6|nr:partitioning defective 3 homolog isoform X1 [Drosophila nasuta]